MTGYDDLYEQAEQALADHEPLWLEDWDAPDSLHGQLKPLLEAAGWERCYHQEGDYWHYKVKVDSGAAYRAWHKVVDEAGYDLDYDVRELEDLAEGIHQGNLDRWWEEVPFRLGAVVVSCGRSNGYLRIPAWESPHGVPGMIKAAENLAQSVDDFKSAKYGEALARLAIALYEGDG